MTDEQLLQRLGAALAPMAAPTTPPPASLQDLHRAIDAVRTARPVPSRRRPRALTIGVAVTLTGACVAIVAVATSMPRWSHETTTRVAVATTSPAFGAVVERQRSLERALDDGDVTNVTIESARLRLALANGPSGELVPIREEIEELLERADTFLRQHRIGNREAPGVSAQGTSTTQPVETTATTQPPTSAPRQVPVPAMTAPDDDNNTDDVANDTEIDDDSSGPGGGGPDDDDDSNSGPGGGGGEPDPDDPDGDSGSGSD